MCLLWHLCSSQSTFVSKVCLYLPTFTQNVWKKTTFYWQETSNFTNTVNIRHPCEKVSRLCSMLNFKSCCIRKNFINFIKCSLQKTCHYFGRLVDLANAMHEEIPFFVLKTSGPFVPVTWCVMIRPLVIRSLRMDVSKRSEFPPSVSSGPSSLSSVQTVSGSASGVWIEILTAYTSELSLTVFIVLQLLYGNRHNCNSKH